MRDWIDSLSASWTLLFPFIFQSFSVFHFHVIFLFLRTFPLVFSQPIPILTLCGQRTILLTSHSFILKYSTEGIMDLMKYVSRFGESPRSRLWNRMARFHTSANESTHLTVSGSRRTSVDFYPANPLLFRWPTTNWSWLLLQEDVKRSFFKWILLVQRCRFIDGARQTCL